MIKKLLTKGMIFISILMLGVIIVSSAISKQLSKSIVVSSEIAKPPDNSDDENVYVEPDQEEDKSEDNNPVEVIVPGDETDHEKRPDGKDTEKK